jgi:26S proteasome regulatory subunit N4
MNSDKSKYNELVERKTFIESQLNDLNQILKDEGDVGMTGNLIDAQLFPRADIDIYKVRITRQQINCLLNDHRQVMDEIERQLESIHSSIKINNQINNQETSSTSLIPFLKITQVDEGSPSAQCGLLINDEIIQLGPFTCNNTNKSLAGIADYVRDHENKLILLNVLRSHQIDKNEDETPKRIKFKLEPKKWSGHGLLGCKFVYID